MSLHVQYVRVHDLYMSLKGSLIASQKANLDAVGHMVGRFSWPDGSIACPELSSRQRALFPILQF